MVTKVHLRRVTRENFREYLNLQVTESQKNLIATTTKSLAEAYVDPNFFPLAVYYVSVCGYEQPEVGLKPIIPPE